MKSKVAATTVRVLSQDGYLTMVEATIDGEAARLRPDEAELAAQLLSTAAIDARHDNDRFAAMPTTDRTVAFLEERLFQVGNEIVLDGYDGGTLAGQSYYARWDEIVTTARLFADQDVISGIVARVRKRLHDKHQAAATWGPWRD